MAYLDSKRRPSAASMAAVIAIHGAMGTALVFGLSVSGVIVKDEIFTGITIDPPAPPPPPKPPEPDTPEAATRDQQIVTPLPPFPLPTTGPELDTTKLILPPLPQAQPGTGEGLSKVVPTPTPSFTAVAATPRTDPKRWVTTEDYRGNWIRQELTGKARFRLEIAADGRVSGCTITGTSGHPELDAATCALVSKRAKFQPARGNEGQPVPGTYSNAIDWQLPE